MQQEVRDSCTDIFTGIHLHHNNLDQAAALDRLAGARLMLGAHTHILTVLWINTHICTCTCTTSTQNYRAISLVLLSQF